MRIEREWLVAEISQSDRRADEQASKQAGKQTAGRVSEASKLHAKEKGGWWLIHQNGGGRKQKKKEKQRRNKGETKGSSEFKSNQPEHQEKVQNP